MLKMYELDDKKKKELNNLSIHFANDLDKIIKESFLKLAEGYGEVSFVHTCQAQDFLENHRTYYIEQQYY